MINANNITFAYPKTKPIFEGFSIEIQSGALYGLLGPNGAGKTSLISLLTGLNKPSTGQITVNQLNYKKDSMRILNNLSLVPQDYAFYEKLTALENLRFFSSLYPDKKNINKNIDEAIHLTGLNEYKNRRAGIFSGGLKRRLNLAIGLLNKPSLLILDEPTVGIDPQSRRFILEAIQSLNAQGTTILYTSHYMNEIEQICDQAAIIDHGKILRQGYLKDLLNKNTSITISVTHNIEKTNLNENLLKFAAQTKLSFKQSTIHCENLPTDKIDVLLALLKENNISIIKIHYGKQSLEDLFFDLTKTQLRES